MVPRRTLLCDLFISLKRLDNAAVGISERKAVDPVAEVVVLRAHEGGEVSVAAHQRDRLARRHVEVARHFVKLKRSVDAASVVGLRRNRAP